MPSHSPRTRFAPTSTIFGMDSVKVVTIPAIICGTALTISRMMVGRFSMREINSVTPASTSWGMDASSASTIAVMIWGRAATMV